MVILPYKRLVTFFSAIAIDQCHERMNKLIKGEGGAVGLTEDPQVLERWMIAGPEISRLIQEFETSFQISKSDISNLHHEQNLNTQNKFVKDVKASVKTFEELGNPFLEDKGELYAKQVTLIEKSYKPYFFVLGKKNT